MERERARKKHEKGFKMLSNDTNKWEILIPTQKTHKADIAKYLWDFSLPRTKSGTAWWSSSSWKPSMRKKKSLYSFSCDFSSRQKSAFNQINYKLSARVSLIKISCWGFTQEDWDFRGKDFAKWKEWKIAMRKSEESPLITHLLKGFCVGDVNCKVNATTSSNNLLSTYIAVSTLSLTLKSSRYLSFPQAATSKRKNKVNSNVSPQILINLILMVSVIYRLRFFNRSHLEKGFFCVGFFALPH